MSPDIIVFEKSFEQRYNEYMDILGSRGPLQASQIQNEWLYYIEWIVEAGGWHAAWKISRQKCEELDIDFPTIVFVMVKLVDFRELQARVSILAVNDDISLPEEHVVPLKCLYPTKQQENEVLDVTATANCLDQYRLFYNHLWQPWDCDDDSEDWLSAHLESRLQLFYDMKNGILLPETTRHIRSLLQEAREIEQKIQASEVENSGSEDIAESNVLTVMQLQIRREQIKREIEILENSELRQIVMKKKHEDIKERRQTRLPSQECCLVWLGGTVDELMETLTKVRNCVDPRTFVKTSPELQEALDQAVADDTVILCPGIHGILSTGGLEEGGNIKGFLEPSATTILSRDKRNVLLDWAGCATLENVTVNASSVKIALSMRHGTVKMHNCRIVGGSGNNTGILIMNYCSFEAEGCEFVDFGTGIAIEHGAQVTLTNCTVSSCSVGIMLFENSSLTLEKCKISDCSKYGIRIEKLQKAEEGQDGRQIGNIVLLESFDNVKLNETKIEGNKKGDVLVIHELDDDLYNSGDSGCFSPESDVCEAAEPMTT